MAKETGFVLKNIFEGYDTFKNFKNSKTIIDSDSRHRTKR